MDSVRDLNAAAILSFFWIVPKEQSRVNTHQPCTLWTWINDLVKDFAAAQILVLAHADRLEAVFADPPS